MRRVCAGVQHGAEVVQQRRKGKRSRSVIFKPTEKALHERVVRQLALQVDVGRERNAQHQRGLRAEALLKRIDALVYRSNCSYY